MDKAVMINKGSISPVRGICIGDENRAINYTKYLREQGFAVTSAIYPTVPLNKSILRVALSAAHTSEQIKDFVKVLAQVLASEVKDVNKIV